MRLPSPAMVVALIALVVAMSGSAYAVTQLPRNSVGTAQLKKNAVTAVKLKNNAVTSAKIKNGTIQVADLSAKARTELKGATGATGATGPRGEQGPTGAQSYGFRVGADGVLVENPSGATGVLDDFAITTPIDGYLLINLDLTAFSPNNVCQGSNNFGSLTVTIDGTPISDLGAANLSAQVVLSTERSALVQLAAGTHIVEMSLECDAPDVIDAATRSSWRASGALYPAQLTATTATG